MMGEDKSAAPNPDDARNARIERILDVLAEIVRGNYEERISIRENDDLLIEVEMAINLVLDELSLSRAQQERQQTELAKKNETMAEQQQRLLRLLSTPILKVWPGVLALPIVGPVGSERRAAIMEAVLKSIVSERATHVVLDLTGVDEPDMETAEFFASAARTIRLLGARCMLSGIGPELALALVDLDTGIHEIPIVSKTSDAIALILAKRG